MPIASYTGAFPATEMRMAGIYVSFQTSSDNVIGSRRVKSIAKDGENYDQEEIQNISEIDRFKEFMACQGDPGTLTVETYFDTRINAILPPTGDMTSSFAGIGQGTVYLAVVTGTTGNFTTTVFFECKANIQSANSISGESGKPMGMQIVFKLTGPPTYYTIATSS